MLRIGAQVHQYLMYLSGVCQDHGVTDQIAANFNGGGNGGPKQFESLVDNEFYLDGFLFMFRLTAERKNLLDQVPGTDRLSGFIQLSETGMVGRLVDASSV
ncbi:MAG: hypothetical protein R2861_05505 [Desulfobacterales bacterium]